MEKIGVLQLTEVSQKLTTNKHVFVPGNFNIFAQLNWQKLSWQTAIQLLSVTLSLVVVSKAERAIAIQKVGSSGAEVTNIQRCLSKLGYYNGPITGKFATLTQNAVIQFQRANKLPTVGFVGVRTQQAIQSQCQSRRSSGSVSSDLRLGSSGQAVTKLQQNLRRLNYFNGPITGSFGSITQQAVIRFQQSNGIRPDGIVGARTKQAISLSLNGNNSSNYTSSYNSSTVYSYPGYNTSYSSSEGIGGDNLPNALNMGDRGNEVRELQQDLQQLGYFQTNPTGYFGSTTQQALARFQQANGIVPNGIGDSQTLGAITTALGGRQNYNNSINSNINTSSCSTATGDICLGERSQRVTVVQQRLQNLGFFNSNITDYYGSETRDAVLQFQRSSQLETTGSVNFQTWQALGLSNNGRGNSTEAYPSRQDNPPPYADNNSPGWNPQRENRYVVVVPISKNDTLDQVRQYIPNAFRAESKLGSYVNAGQFRERSQAEQLSKWLRSRGLDARVNYL